MESAWRWANGVKKSSALVGEFLGLHGEFGGEEGVGLSHGVFGAVEDIEDEPAEEGEADLAAAVEDVFAALESTR
jgi:hypothetical protein